MNNKALTFVAVILLVIFVFSACQKESNNFMDDKNGRIAEGFFPELDSLPNSSEADFEYRKTSTYEGYYLRIPFSAEDEYRRFLNEVESTYSDMTERQRQKSYFIIDNVHFVVDDFSFRAVNMDEFGQTDEPYVGLIGHCDSLQTVVFMYFWNEFAGIESIEIGMGPSGYMEFYCDTWSADRNNASMILSVEV